MDEDLGSRMGSKQRKRLVERLDQMVESGRVTAQEAEGLRTARGAAEFDDVVRGIRLRHATAKLETAVDDGSMSQEEADGFLERLRNGEHPRGLRAHLGQLRPRRRSGES